MRKYFTLEKLLALLLLSSGVFAQKMEFRSLNDPRTAVRGISNGGNAALIGYTYNYATNSFVKIDTGIISYANMNVVRQLKKASLLHRKSKKHLQYSYEG
ncbi:hypothetical protein [Empedobacter sp. GD03797]|uniref:hypothetical protein n=1 Tax=Empedobacter sp. GD03797 TaxID=2975382 RepID=UPI00244AE8A7|nr:hypothetical protein [Empedobacter sp. GD03797]MDH1882972.1 hypothetical protein [Empedobacter sp. GD03797]